jgi:hypothetical protein
MWGFYLMKKEDFYRFLYGTSSDSPEERPRWIGLAIGFVAGLALYAVIHGLGWMG